MLLTLERCKELQKQLEAADAEMDAIAWEFYIRPGAQNVGGNIGQLSIMHAQLVEDLANKIRELETEKNKS